MTILLGTYGKLATPFYLYVHKSKTYFALQDINFVYFNEQLDTKTKLIKKMLDCNSKDFMREKSTGNILLLTQKIIRIARYFQCYSLAELCKLSLDEILAQVAQPLLSTIRCDQWNPVTNKVTIVERDLQFEALDGEEWPFIAPHVAPTAKQTLPPIQLPQANTNPIYKWLSFNLFEKGSSPETIQALLTTTKTSKQQQAIIDTRQRKTAFTLTHTKQKIPRKRQIRSKSKLPPSPPQSNKRLKTALPPPCFDNLTLLATQATQLRGLLLSPEISPSPPLPNHQHRLPSLQTLLSDLKNHSFP